MEETVGQRAGHGAGDGPVLRPVARRHDVPAGGNGVERTEAAVQNELVSRHLKRLVGGSQLVEEDDAPALGVPRPFAGNQPFDRILLFIGNGQTPHVHGFPLGETDVDEADAEFSRQLPDGGGFPHPRRAPDHHRRDQQTRVGVFRMQCGIVFPEGVQIVPQKFLEFVDGDRSRRFRFSHVTILSPGPGVPFF